ncbi:MAG: ParA family protein, partial [Deltaproteobacteria bacterium]|nr:ParA family protein [Deltaproteobacteria bacterium]
PNVEDTASLEPDLITSAPRSFFTLREKLRPYARQHFDFTFIDNPPNMGTFVLCSLYASDFVIVPNTAGSKFSMEGLIKALKLTDKIRENGNPDLKFLKLLINQVDRRTASSKATIEYIKRHFSEEKVFNTTIPVNATFQRAEEFDQTIIRYSPSSPGSRAYRELAKELVAIFEPESKLESAAPPLLKKVKKSG